MFVSPLTAVPLVEIRLMTRQDQLRVAGRYGSVLQYDVVGFRAPDGGLLLGQVVGLAGDRLALAHQARGAHDHGRLRLGVGRADALLNVRRVQYHGLIVGLLGRAHVVGLVRHRCRLGLGTGPSNYSHHGRLAVNHLPSVDEFMPFVRYGPQYRGTVHKNHRQEGLTRGNRGPIYAPIGTRYGCRWVGSNPCLG